MPEPGPVIFEERDAANGKAIGIITLSVEKTLNSLTLPMCEMMLEQLRDWRDNPRIAAIWLRGAGEKAFCAGGDVQELYRSATKTPGGPCVEAETFFEEEYRLDYLLHVYPKPVVCWGDGIVMGGGLGLFAGCSHAIVTEKTRIGMPEVTIALYPDVGGTWFLNRMPGKCGLFVALTGAPLNAADALYAGLARFYTESDREEALLDALTCVQWRDETEGNHQLLSDLLGEQAVCAAPMESPLEAHREQIDALCAGEDLQTVVDNILSLDTEDKWLQKTRTTLEHGSPVAINTIWNQLHRGAALSLEEVFQFELMISTNVVRHPEFAEGVRALLIDKDKSPKWMYPSSAQVPASLMERFFTAPWAQNPLNNLAGA